MELKNKFENATDAFEYFNEVIRNTIHFCILDEKLNMSVMMRSNDLWYGFCNDQYCFSMLQQMVADRLSIGIGTYYHFANNLHLYNNKL
jgi:thymidylate synthase